MNYSCPHYTLSTSTEDKLLQLNMQVQPEFCYTSSFPTIQKFLSSHAPQVLKTKCFNPQKLPFSEEVLDTEMGHLFEHLLIQDLCDETIKSGASHACFRADTEWNWKENPKGSFSIKIYAPVKKEILIPALQHSIDITNQLFRLKH